MFSHEQHIHAYLGSIFEIMRSFNICRNKIMQDAFLAKCPLCSHLPVDCPESDEIAQLKENTYSVLGSDAKVCH